MTHFWNFGTFISGTVEAINFKFGTKTNGSEFYIIKCKIRSKLVMWTSRDPVLEFWEPPDFLVTVEGRNIKFGMDTDGSEF